MRCSVGEHVDVDAHGLQLEARDLAVDLQGHVVHGEREILVVLGDVLRAQRLVGEAHVHHRGGVSLGCGEIEQASLGKHVHGASVVQPVRLDERARIRDLRRHVVDGGEVDLVVEMPAVGDDRAVLETLDVRAIDDVDVAGHGDHDVGAPAPPRRAS